MVAAVLTVVGLYLNRPVASSRADLAQLSFGFPRRWMIQSSYQYTDSFPATVSLTSPKESPTSILAGQLVESYLIWLAVALVFAALVLSLRELDRRRRLRLFQRRQD